MSSHGNFLDPDSKIYQWQFEFLGAFVDFPALECMQLSNAHATLDTSAVISLYLLNSQKRVNFKEMKLQGAKGATARIRKTDTVLLFSYNPGSIEPDYDIEAVNVKPKLTRQTVDNFAISESENCSESGVDMNGTGMKIGGFVHIGTNGLDIKFKKDHKRGLYYGPNQGGRSGSGPISGS